MLTGPGPAAKKCLSIAGLDKSEIDLWEINEAFASVALRYMKDLDLDHEITNVNGGAIAMGHPLGATGAMILGTVLDELERRDQNTALVTLCIGAGPIGLLHIGLLAEWLGAPRAVAATAIEGLVVLGTALMVWPELRGARRRPVAENDSRGEPPRSGVGSA